jgi:hypothetical protein
MNLARLTTRIGAHLLFTLLFFLGWAWLNIEVIATPAWVDVLFAGSVVIWLLSETRLVDPLIRSRNRGLLTILSWSTLSAALCVAVAWAVQGLVNFQAQTFIRDVLFPLAAAEELIVDLRDQVQARSYGLQSDEWGILARALGGLSVLALLVAMLTRLAWLSLWPHIALVLVQVRIALPTLRLRHRRIDQWFWRIGLVLAAVLMLIVWFGGRRTPPAAAFDWRNSIAGPALPLQVTDIVVDPRRGWIFAATDAGVFRSEDAGATWQPMNRVSTIRATFRHLALDPHIDRLYALEAVVGGGRVYQFDLGAPPDTAGWAFIGENGTTAAIQEAAAATGERVFGTGSLGRVTFIAPIPRRKAARIRCSPAMPTRTSTALNRKRGWRRLPASSTVQVMAVQVGSI